MRNKKGFTLAEVLVTLAIIGVVAALTIPALVQTSNTKQFTAGVKKAMSVLNQALVMSIAENGTDLSTCSNCQNAMGLRDLFDDYLSVIKTETTYTTNDTVITADGMTYVFYKTLPDSKNCGAPANSDPGDTISPAGDALCLVEVDVNGAKGGSIASAGSTFSDIYYFVLEPAAVVPANAVTAGFDPTTWGRASSIAGSDPDVDDIAIDAITN